MRPVRLEGAPQPGPAPWVDASGMVKRTCTAAITTLLAIGAASAQGATQIATNPAGDQVLFHQVLGQRARSLYATVRHAGGGFGSVQQVAPAPGEPAVFKPEATVDDGGGIVAMWGTYDPLYTASLYSTTASVAVGASDGTFGAPTELFSGSAGTTKIASNARGDTIVGFAGQGQPAHYVYRAAGGQFGDPAPLPGSGSLAGVAVDADGAALAVWDRDGQVEQATRAPGGDFGPVSALTGVPRNHGALTFAAARNGRALIVFAEGRRTVRVIERPPGGSFGEPFTVAKAKKGDRIPIAVAVAPSGAAAVGYADSHRHAWLRARDAGGPFTAPRSIGVDGPRIAVNDSGDAAAVWDERAHVVHALYRRRGASRFRGPRTLAPPRPFAPGVGLDGDASLHPSLALEGSGRATAVWEQWDGVTVSAVARDFDGSAAAPPVVVDSLPSFVREGPKSTCLPADGGAIVRRSAQSTVLLGDFQDRLGCLLARGKPVSLAPYEGETMQPKRTIVLAGPLVGYGLDFVGHGDAESDFIITDLRDERYGLNRAAKMDRTELAMLVTSRLKENGAAAWISCPDTSQDPRRQPACRRPGGTVKHVWAWGRRQTRPRLLDSGRRVDPRSFRLDGSRLTWRRAGKLHHATLR
jgi:hypothetical protein